MKRSTKKLLLAGALAAAVLFGIWLVPGRGVRPRIIVLVSVDTLRPDHLGSYGYERPTSPRLDAVAAEGAVFEDVSSPAPWTLPAHGSMLTGLYPSRHGLTTHDRYLPTSVETLALVLSKAGYHTAAVVNSHNLSPRYGLDRGFQKYRYVEESVDRVEPSTEIVDQAITWLREAGNARFFLFLHTYDAHSDYRSLPRYEKELVRPYDGPADGTTAQLIAVREGKAKLDARDAAHLMERYDAGIRQVDDELGRLLDFLREAKLLDETLLLITSDHGEEFFEHGGFLHGRTQYQEVMAVPLIMRGPGIPPGAHVKDAVSLLDIVPTILSRAGVAGPGSLDGVDVSSLWTGAPTPLPDRMLFGEADHNNVEPEITRAVRHRSYKLHYNRLTQKKELYDLAADPGERKDLMAEKPGVADQLFREIVRFMEIKAERATPATKLTPEQLEKLRSLGYIN